MKVARFPRSASVRRFSEAERREVEGAVRVAFPDADRVEAHPRGDNGWYAEVWNGKGARIVLDPREPAP